MGENLSLYLSAEQHRCWIPDDDHRLCNMIHVTSLIKSHFMINYLFLYGRSASTSVVSFKLYLTSKYPRLPISSLQNFWMVKASDRDTEDRHFNAVDFESRLVVNGEKYSPL